MTNKEALKWFIDSVKWHEKEYPFHNPNNKQVKAYKQAIKALQFIEALKKSKEKENL